MGRGKAYDTLMDEEDQIAPKAHAVFILMAMSVAEFSATADVCFVRETSECMKSAIDAEFALAVGIVSFILCVVLLGMYHAIGVKRSVEVTIALVLALLWGLAMILNTSQDGPFPSVGNGYFATWFGLLASWYYLYLTAQKLQTVLDREVMIQNSALATVFIASLFEFSTAAKDCHSNETCTDERAFAVAVGVLSFIFSMFQLMFVRLGAPAGIVCAKPIGMFLVILWSAGLGSNTSSKGPFNSPCEHANGFFATWICWAASLQYCYFAVFGPLPTASQMYEDYGDEDDEGQGFVDNEGPGAYGAIAKEPIAEKNEY
jgi:hypothetical protein